MSSYVYISECKTKCMSCCVCISTAYQLPDASAEENLLLDLTFFRAIMEQEELADFQFGPAARRRRNLDARRFRSEEREIVVDPQIDLICHTLMIEWFHRDIQTVFEMSGDDEEYILEHGSIWQEIYVCMLRFCLPNGSDRQVRQMYWTRAVYCLFLVREAGCGTGSRLWHDLLHYMRVPEIFIECSRIVARECDQFIQVRGGMNIVEEE
eukprot:GHVU01144260.1.p1 GENE.GHVU01144260.1~~GHVU01144260.1.p1  ORF type:complete len:210 (+),score=14.79 GHVU01144260.1:1202-1831(+)